MTSFGLNSLVVCGLPGSGKTTYLAALWHLVQSQEIETKLTLQSLSYGDYEYLNAIRARWQRGQKQVRNVGEAPRIGLDLKSTEGQEVSLLFLDHSGETFDRLWETRSCTDDVAEHLKDRLGVLLFLRSQGLKEPVPLTEMLRLEREMEDALPNDSESSQQQAISEVDWKAEDAPDQVKIVDLLQSLSNEFRMRAREKLAIVVSAWDRVTEYDSAEQFIRSRMPLLAQYLNSEPAHFELRFFAVSAQGGEYLEEDPKGEYPDALTTLLSLDAPSKRIRMIHSSAEEHDLTVPLAWLMSNKDALDDA